MLKKKDIIYPITFTSFGVGKFTMLSERSGQFVGRDGAVRNICEGINHFINQHNRHNPQNLPGLDYFYEMNEAEGVSGECNVEDMPLCARLTGVKHEGEWINLSIQPVRIEVDGDTVTFLLHHTFRKGAFAGEVSTKKGTKVRWEKRAISLTNTLCSAGAGL